MMDRETQLKIQAFLDNELVEHEAREISALVARDREAAALHAELKNTRRALAGAEKGITLPESREFYWSKIQRQIDEAGQREAVQPEPSLWQLISRLFKPVSAVAVIVLLGMIVFNVTGSGGGPDLMVASSDMDAITFRDDSDGTTYVWFADKQPDDEASDFFEDDDLSLN